MTHASVTLLLCSRLLAIFISPLNYLRGKREVRLPIETLSKICKALLQGSGNHVFMHFIRAKWERENSERLRYFLKCFLESKSLSLSSALIIDISLQSYGNSSIAGVPEITKPKKENRQLFVKWMCSWWLSLHPRPQKQLVFISVESNT